MSLNFSPARSARRTSRLTCGDEVDEDGKESEVITASDGKNDGGTREK